MLRPWKYFTSHSGSDALASKTKPAVVCRYALMASGLIAPASIKAPAAARAAWRRAVG
jgi:hypothetical protein